MSKEIAFRQLSPSCTLRLIFGDLTEERVDAIVNAANSQLTHAGGLAAAIVRKGGEQIQEESEAWVRDRGPVPHDRPAWTHAGNLPCKRIIHAVGPVWGVGEEELKLAAAVKGSLRVAKELGLRSIAFPAISTGIFRFPKPLAAQVMLDAVEEFAQEASDLAEIHLTLFDQPTLEAFADAFQNRWPSPSN